MRICVENHNEEGWGRLCDSVSKPADPGSEAV